jgi:hypothetical protein
MNDHDDINSGLFKSTHARATRNKIGEQENFDKTQRWAACKKSIKGRDEKFTRQLFSKEQGGAEHQGNHCEAEARGQGVRESKFKTHIKIWHGLRIESLQNSFPIGLFSQENPFILC